MIVQIFLKRSSWLHRRFQFIRLDDSRIVSCLLRSFSETQNVHPKTLFSLDNHLSHEAVESARLQGITLTTHPHAIHNLQRLSKTIFQSFEVHFDRFLNNWIKSISSSTFTIYQIAGISKEAYDIAFSRKDVQSAFKSTGVFSMNIDIYGEDEFLPSDITDRTDQP